MNLESLWTLLNTYQLLVVVGMLEIEYPTKVDAFMHGFEFASLNVPDEYNVVLVLFPEDEEANSTATEYPEEEISETNERFDSYGFTSAVFFVQQATFSAVFIGAGLIYGLLKVVALLLGGDTKVFIEKRIMSIVLAILMRVVINFASPVCTSIVINFRFL